MSDQIPILTVDGPGGSGKGTLSLRLANALGWHFLDSGAIYRLFALAATQHQIDINQETELETLAKNLDIFFSSEGEIFLEGNPVKTLIRTEIIGNIASKIATFPRVRNALLQYQRDFCKPPGLVADGRDMGTVVFPNAFLKIYLEASIEARALRRYKQLKDVAFNVTLQSLLAEIKERDARDKQRVASPLKPAKDAVVIDTTEMAIETVFETVMSQVKHRLY